MVGSSGFETTNPPRSRRVFVWRFHDSFKTRISGDSGVLPQQLLMKIEAKQRGKK